MSKKPAKIINIDNYVDAYKAYIEVLFGRSLAVGPKSTKEHTDFFNNLFKSPDDRANA